MSASGAGPVAGRSPVQWATWAVMGLAVLLILAFSVTTIPGVRGTPGFHTGLDGWLQGTAYVVIAVGGLLGAALLRTRPLAWRLFAAAMALRALGFVVFLGHVRLENPQPYPSIADYCWLAMDALLLAGLWVLLRTRLRGRSYGVLFDALLVGLTAAGASVVLLFHTLDTISGVDRPDEVLVTNLAYPLTDLGLLVLAIGALVASGLRARATAVLTAGIAGFAVVDSVFLYKITSETYRPGTWLAALSLVATAAIAFSPTVPGRLPREFATRQFSRLALAVVSGLVSVAALMFCAFEKVTLTGILLPAAALVVGIARAVWTVAANQAVADFELGEKQAELLRFQSLVETSSDFVAMARPDGVVMYVNPAGRRLVGIEDRDVSGMSIADFLTEEALAASIEIEQPAVVEHGRWSGESTLRDHRGGPPIPVAISSFLMRDADTGEPFALATVQRDISERVAAESALASLAEERARLLDRLVEAQEDERARIAADVHDDSVQALAAVELRLGLLRRQLGDGQPQLLETAEALATTVTGAIGRLRALLFDLETPAVETDLATALSLAADNAFGDRLRWRVDGDAGPELAQAQRITAYRIAREAMSNVVRHADAEYVEIRVGRAGSGIEVVVDDDGRGFDPATIARRAGHLGIPAMTDRATVAGGRLDVVRREGGGTRVRLWLPSAPGAGTPAEQGEPEGPA